MGVAAPAEARFSGRSLAAALRGREEPPEVAAYAESLLPLLHFGWSDLRAIREGRWKYIQAPRPELYDLKDDPGETRNLGRPLMRAALAGPSRILDAAQPSPGLRVARGADEQPGAWGALSRGQGRACAGADPGQDRGVPGGQPPDSRRLALPKGVRQERGLFPGAAARKIES
jgi:hypothetical protein